MLERQAHINCCKPCLWLTDCADKKCAQAVRHDMLRQRGPTQCSFQA